MNIMIYICNNVFFRAIMIHFMGGIS